MNIDKTVKALLALIALALCVIALNPWLPHSSPTVSVDLRQVHSDLSEIRQQLARIELDGELLVPVLREEVLPGIKRIESNTEQIDQIALNTQSLQGR